MDYQMHAIGNAFNKIPFHISGHMDNIWLEDYGKLGQELILVIMY